MKPLKATFLLAAAATALHAEGQSLIGLGTHGGSDSYANAVSADGSAVVGHAQNSAGFLRAFRWTAGVMTDLGTLGGELSEARGVSADGSVVVGYSINGSEQSRAFRWTGGVMTDLGTLGSELSEARGVSADGAVVVGHSINGSGQGRAFRWTGGVMTDLGTLGGNFSDAIAISADGAVVVGNAQDGNSRWHAFRWTGGVMTDLGTLGGDYAEARGVSADGAVVVGNAQSGNGPTRGFRWTGGVMTDLGTLGGELSETRGVSADGAVVFGNSANGAGKWHAFRWTAGAMADLGTLGGDYSNAVATSADGSVVVGNSMNGANYWRAFRWTGGVMTDLGTLGGDYAEARGVSADGSTVVGYSDNASGQARAFLHRSRTMLDVQDWLGSVGGVCSMLSTSLEITRLHLEGAHHRPLAELGRGKSYWATGDVAGSSRSRDLMTRSGEAGATFEPWTNVLLGVGAGYARLDQQLANDGSGTTFGQYLVSEVDFLLSAGGMLSILISSGDWENETDRGYVTGGGIDHSHGETEIKSTAFRLRYDSPTLAKALGADLKAYVSYGHSRARAEGYVETGGSYAGAFGETEQTAKEGRLGVAATRAFGEKFRGRLSAEWIRRFDREQPVLTATDITSTLDLSLPGAPVVRDQARFGFDLDYLMDAQTTLSFTAHAAGRGESPDLSGAISLRRGF